MLLHPNPKRVFICGGQLVQPQKLHDLHSNTMHIVTKCIVAPVKQVCKSSCRHSSFTCCPVAKATHTQSSASGLSSIRLLLLIPMLSTNACFQVVKAQRQGRYYDTKAWRKLSWLTLTRCVCVCVSDSLCQIIEANRRACLVVPVNAHVSIKASLTQRYTWQEFPIIECSNGQHFNAGRL